MHIFETRIRIDNQPIKTKRDSRYPTNFKIYKTKKSKKRFSKLGSESNRRQT